jgi:hypothetical protein
MRVTVAVPFAVAKARANGAGRLQQRLASNLCCRRQPFVAAEAKKYVIAPPRLIPISARL